MPYTRTFAGLTPPRRYDGVPFVSVEIRESATETGTYAMVETIALSPVDSKPSGPATRNFTTTDAALADGWYVIRWVGRNGSTVDSAAIHYGVASFAPTVAEVASLLRARTTDADQEEAGTFNTETRPTETQVQALIDQATDDVLVAFVGGVVPTASESAARRAVALRTAYMVEITFFPEQSTSPGEDSAYLQLRSMADAALQGLVIGTQLRDLFGLTDG